MNQVSSAATVKKVNLLGLTASQLSEFLQQLNEPSYRAQQLLKWIHQAGVTDFSQMTNLSKALRQRLAQVAEIKPPQVIACEVAEDGTRKWAIAIPGGSAIETVYIPAAKRGTLCISSQAGCALDCSFCATGKQGFNRNLTSAEIIGQLWLATAGLTEWQQTSGPRPITNVVMMGMGEPLLNVEAVFAALELMQDDCAYGLAKRRVTLSTSGIIPGIEQLGQVSQVSLALSLHAPNDALRNELMPINKKYPLSPLLAACRRYAHRLGERRQITMEYVLLEGVNDQPEHAKQLIKLLQPIPCKVNLIPFNPFPHSQYRRSSRLTINAFQQILQQAGLVVTERMERGGDISAACGQLVGQIQDRTRRSHRYQAGLTAGQMIPVAQHNPRAIAG